MFSLLSRRLIGPRLPQRAADEQKLSSVLALPILASDALSSVAYATEAALGVLVLAGSAALGLSLPITAVIALLIVVVVFSYRQTIEAYPQGGGAYVVSRENLGSTVSLVAAASLLIDYVLTAAVSLMAGTQALSSLLPALLPYEDPIAIALLVIVGWINLRGLRDSGQAFALPTYGFVLMIALLALMGGGQLLLHGFHPQAPPPAPVLEGLSLFLVLRAFSSGCSAMTGIEAIANGVQVFRAPSAQRARTTLLVMGAMLVAMVLSVSALAFAYGIAPDPSRTVLAQIGMRVFGERSPLFWGLQITTLLILMLAANTAFADFPRLSALLARDRFLPNQMAWVGDRLVFQNGILLLLVATGVIILLCHGDTTVAVNLYALGVFMAFTLSQAGMVVHWWRHHGKGWLARMLMNAAGALSTLLVLVVIVVSKFSEGAWTVVIAIPLLVIALARIRRRYERVLQAIALPEATAQPLQMARRVQPIGNDSVVWVPSISVPTLEALRYASTISDRVMAVWVRNEEEDAGRIQRQWRQWVADDPLISLTVLESPYASLIDPFVDFVRTQEESAPERTLTIVMPMAIPRYRFDGLLLNQRGLNMRLALDAHQSRIFSLVRFYLPA